ncbi:Uncharacterized protein APZ42_003695 [Daphnia magna]|uniref:Uncharacterized protein n=1 Tax=Daphnia magna TaxID=35525 RepID=A0A168EKE6_9CRUS|nr:Uncharacterized protein APZ42_003695 [Daphnia magna]
MKPIIIFLVSTQTSAFKIRGDARRTTCTQSYQRLLYFSILGSFGEVIRVNVFCVFVCMYNLLKQHQGCRMARPLAT